MNIRSLLMALLAVICWNSSPQSTFAQKKGPAKPQPVKLPPSILSPKTGEVIKVAPIDKSTRASVESAADQIDQILQKTWTEKEVKARPALKDEQYLRRVYLEIGGRIPTLDEASEFILSKSKDKRAELLDKLLESPDYVSHFYNYWADILRLCERPQAQLVMDPYMSYVKEKIAENKPYDKWVHEMLTATGKVWENPAVGFQLRDDGMPLPYVDNTVRVFLGKQIGCAQCHDHPFDSWTQKQFYELAAFTAGTRTKATPADLGLQKTANPVGELLKEARAKVPDGKLKTPIQTVLVANRYDVNFANRELKLPHDYAYDDSKPNTLVKPKVLWGDVPSNAKGADRREQFAAWVTSREDRQFARNIANRMWKKMMGRGIVEPIDDFRPENPPSNPELLEHLTDEVLRLNFDLRELVRIIATTKAYQRLAVIHDETTLDPYYFEAPVLHRMTSEQLWDSLLTLIAYNQWAYQRPTAKELADVIELDLGKAKLADAERVTEKFAATFNLPAYNKELQKLCGFKGQLLVRASEIPTPVPLSHFLRQFGQSDRESIEGGRTSATVPQILTMFNGSLTHILLEKGSVIYDNVMKAPRAKAIDVIFVSILSHLPSATDRELAQNELRTSASPEAGYGNLIWALLNTREFIFIQ
jgi:hypothetical protein